MVEAVALPRIAANYLASGRALRDRAPFLFLTCLMLSALLIFEWGPSGLPAASALGIALGFSFLEPAFAFCAYLASLILRPWELANDPIFNLIPRLGAIAAIVTALAFGFKQKRWHVVPQARTLAFFLAWLFLTTMKAPDAGAAVSQAMSLMIPAATLFLLAQFWIYDEHSYELLIDSLSISIVTVAVLSIAQYLLSQNGSRIEGAGIFANSNDLAALCVLSFPFIARAWIRAGSPSMIRRILSVALCLPLLVTIYWAQSRGALLALGAIGAGGILMKVKRLRFSALLPLLIAALVATLLTSKRSEEDLEQSTASRVEYLVTGLRMATSNPLFGVGWGRYPDEFDQYSRNAQFEFGSRTAHNSWILVLAETGWLGLGLYLSLFVAGLRSAWSLREKKPELLLALIGYGTTMTFLSHSYLFYPYLLLGIVFGASHLEREKAIV
jgi:hypothetical protein